MAIQQTTDNDKFKDARERYARNVQPINRTEVLEGDADQSINNVIIDFIKEQSKRASSVKNGIQNNNILGSLSTKGITTDKTGFIQTIKANDNLVKINDSIKKYMITEPIKIDDARLSREDTLKTGVNYLKIISDSLPKLGKFIEEFSTSLPKLKDYFTNGSFIKSMTSLIEKFSKPLYSHAKEIIKKLSELIRIEIANKTSDTQEARMLNTSATGIDTSQMNGGDKPSFKEKMVNKASDKFPRIVGFLAQVGGLWAIFKGISAIFLKNSIIKAIVSKGAAVLTAFTKSLPLVSRLMSFIGGMSRLMTGVVGIILASPFYAMIKNPEQMMGYATAFTKLFDEVIVPAFQWIMKEIVPPLTIAFAGLMVAVEYFMDTFGSFVNNTLIYILGTALPEVAKTIGSMINTVWQGFKELALRIMGIFGVGPYGEDGIISNLTGMISNVWNTIGGLMWEIPDRLMRAFGLEELFGLMDGEKLFGRMKRFIFEDIPNFFTQMGDDIFNYVKSINPIETIKDKIQSLINAIVAIIPSYNDISKFIRDSLPAWTPDSVKDWFNEHTSASPDLRNSASAPVRKPPSAIFDVDKSPARQSTNLNIFNSTSNSPTVVNGTSGGRNRYPIGNTRPISDPLNDDLIRILP